MEDIEIWIPVKGYEGLYECSTHGRIKSLSKLIPATRNRGVFWTVGKILAMNTLTPDGYISVTLYGGKDRHKYPKTLHKFIFYSFNPESYPKKGFEIDHIDNDKLNNRPDNLRQITSRENSTKRSLQFKKSSKYTGVHLDKDRKSWSASIRVKGKKTRYLGRHSNEEDASAAYQKALKEILKSA